MKTTNYNITSGSSTAVKDFGKGLLLLLLMLALTIPFIIKFYHYF